VRPRRLFAPFGDRRAVRAVVIANLLFVSGSLLVVSLLAWPSAARRCCSSCDCRRCSRARSSCRAAAGRACRWCGAAAVGRALVSAQGLAFAELALGARPAAGGDRPPPCAVTARNFGALLLFYVPVAVLGFLAFMLVALVAVLLGTLLSMLSPSLAPLLVLLLSLVLVLADVRAAVHLLLFRLARAVRGGRPPAPPLPVHQIAALSADRACSSTQPNQVDYAEQAAPRARPPAAKPGPRPARHRACGQHLRCRRSGRAGAAIAAPAGDGVAEVEQRPAQRAAEMAHQRAPRPATPPSAARTRSAPGACPASPARDPPRWRRSTAPTARRRSAAPPTASPAAATAGLQHRGAARVGEHLQASASGEGSRPAVQAREHPRPARCGAAPAAAPGAREQRRSSSASGARAAPSPGSRRRSGARTGRLRVARRVRHATALVQLEVAGVERRCSRRANSTPTSYSAHIGSAIMICDRPSGGSGSRR
jgi:hypothetical protein